MKAGLKALPLILLVLLFVSFQTPTRLGASPGPDTLIRCKVTDADTNKTISNASVLVWDGTTWIDAFSTDSEGECNITGLPAGKYTLFVYKGNLTAGVVDYLPQGPRDVQLEEGSTKNVSFGLVPGAAVHFSGEISVVEAVGPPLGFSVEIIDPRTGSPPELNGSYIAKYNSTVRSFLVEKGSLDKDFVFVPTEVLINLRVDAIFFERDLGLFHVEFLVPDINLSEHILNITKYSLTSSIGVVTNRLRDGLREVDEAWDLGFFLPNERRTLDTASSDVPIRAHTALEAGEYVKCWGILREAVYKAEAVHLTLENYKLISLSGAVYLPAFFAVYSVILGFFLFEQDRRKLVSSLSFYLVFLVALYLIYPGTRLMVRQSLSLFAEAAGASILATLAIVFGLPRVWRGPGIEGLQTFKNVLGTMLSMGKRQIKLRKTRGFLTISSIVILVLAFTSLTSFGTVYGITSKSVTSTPKVDGILMRRAAAEESVFSFFSHLPVEYVDSLSTLVKTTNVAPKLESVPDPTGKPIAKIVKAERTVDIYGTLGVAPTNETFYTQLNDTVDVGDYLDDRKGDDVLISLEAASNLGVNSGEIVQLYVEGAPGFVVNLTVKGLFDDDKYQQITDLDGQPFGPKRMILRDDQPTYEVCNGTDVIIMHWESFVGLQEALERFKGEKPTTPTFDMLSRVVFQPADWGDLDSIVETIAFKLDCDSYVSRGGGVTCYYLGYYLEAKGTAELMIPLVMVCLNVGAVMLNAVYERRQEMRVLTVVGSNPAHLAMVFIAEAIVVGMVGGGVGYLFGLGFYRVMALFGTGIEVRAKLEWYWSAIGFSLAILASVLSAVRPALMAVKMYTPSMVRRVKVSEEEKEVRKKEIFTVSQARRLTMPVKVYENDALFFFSYVLSRLKDLEAGAYERVEDLKELPETKTPSGQVTKKIVFSYVYISGEQKTKMNNEIICSKDADEDSYRVQLVSTPAQPGTPEEWVYRNAETLRDICMDWMKNRKKIMGLS